MDRQYCREPHKNLSEDEIQRLNEYRKKKKIKMRKNRTTSPITIDSFFWVTRDFFKINI